MGVTHLDVATEGADHPAGNRLLIPKCIAERDDRLADHQVARGADPNHAHRFGGRNFDDREVGGCVVCNHFGYAATTVVERNFYAANVGDDVVVGEDVAAAIDDRSSTHAIHLARGLAGFGVCGISRFDDRLLAAYADHSRPCVANGEHDRRDSLRGYLVGCCNLAGRQANAGKQGEVDPPVRECARRGQRRAHGEWVISSGAERVRTGGSTLSEPGHRRERERPQIRRSEFRSSPTSVREHATPCRQDRPAGKNVLNRTKRGRTVGLASRAHHTSEAGIGPSFTRRLGFLPAGFSPARE